MKCQLTIRAEPTYQYQKIANEIVIEVEVKDEKELIELQHKYNKIIGEQATIDVIQLAKDVKNKSTNPFA